MRLQLTSFYKLTCSARPIPLLLLFLVVVSASSNAINLVTNTSVETTATRSNNSQLNVNSSASKPASTISQASTATTATSRSSSSSSSQHQPGATISEQLQLDGKCATKSSCKQRGRRLELDGGPDKRSCYCDEKCFQYDDCCLDSAWSRPFKQRIELGLERLRQSRQQWHCHRVNPIFGDILLRASCSPEWLASEAQHEKPELVEQVRRRCEYVKDRGKRQSHADHQTDPVGMMMPITDLTSGITYANSYCLRCNRLSPARTRPSNGKPDGQQQQQAAQQAPKLIYWSPLLTCNYNLETDERNTLYDLISAHKGQVLKYSSRRNKWIIDTSNTTAATTTTAANPNEFGGTTVAASAQNDRVCSITPTIPDSVEHIIRYCRSNTIDSCPPKAPAGLDSNRAREYEAWKLECHFGHQALVYSLTSDAIYFNLACARCHQEKQVFCEPKLKKGLGFGVSKVTIAQSGANSLNETGTRILSAPTEDTTEETPGDWEPPGSGPEWAPPGGSSIGKEVARGGAGEAKSSKAFSGSFSILIDLYGSSQGDEQVGVVHQCPDLENQVYDPFHNLCRDIVCGLGQQQSLDGKCVDLKGTDQLRVGVVDKFKPAMVYLTTGCLVVSIASLSMYLALYCLSMLDLRRLVVDMAQAEQHLGPSTRNSPMEKHRASKCSSVGGCSTSSTRGSQSLSSRGVACLAASLLTAYMFFILGHQPDSQAQETPASTQDPAAASAATTTVGNSNSTPTSGQDQLHQPPAAVTVTCLALALGTYYCFLVAFNWMFLLSYDIWRTLRLATRQLRGPAMHSQSKRFLSYMLFSLLVSGSIVAIATLVDQIPFECGDHQAAGARQGAAATSGKNCSGFERDMGDFFHTYRPKFGHRAGSCWFSNRRSLALFFGVPVASIMFLNLLFFLHSSCMVIRTSTRSSRHKNNANSNGAALPSGHGQDAANCKQSSLEPKLISVILHSDAANCSQESTETQSDYVHQNSLTTNSMISVQTIQSHLSSAASSAEESSAAEESPGPDTKSTREMQQHQQQPPGSANNSTCCQKAAMEAADSDPKRRQLVASLSSGSLTNQSIGGVSLSTSLVLKYDSHIQQLGSVMSSVVKDYRLYCRLSTIMGLTWLTGLMASVVDQSDTLWYVFVVLNTLQGLFIFIAFGCKRSKLNNVEILVSYCQFRWRQLGDKWRQQKPTPNEPPNGEK